MDNSTSACAAVATRATRKPCTFVRWIARTVTLLLAATPSLAAACAFVPDDVDFDHVFQVDYTATPDVLLGSHSAAYSLAQGCDSGNDGSTIFWDVMPALSGLQYVRDIGGLPAHSIVGLPGSPLVTIEAVFPLRTYRLRAGQLTQGGEWYWDVGPAAGLELRIKLYSPGGIMNSVPATTLGTVTTDITSRPSPVQLRQNVRLGVYLRGATCSLADTTLGLDDLPANALPATGATAGEKAFAVSMDCTSNSTPVKLTLVDANDASNRTDVLSPATGSTAGGVGLQLLRGGNAIPLGLQWDHGFGNAGRNQIDFQARYVRTGDVMPGDIKAEAVLTADYP